MSCGKPRWHWPRKTIIHARLSMVAKKPPSFVVDDIKSKLPHAMLFCFEKMRCFQFSQKASVPQQGGTMNDAREVHRGKSLTIDGIVYNFGLVVWELTMWMSLHQITLVSNVFILKNK